MTRLKNIYLAVAVLVAVALIYGGLRAVREWTASPGKEYRCAGSNVILISVDALRADHLGCYGYNRNTSPTIDQLASEGLVFDNHIATMSLTLPSHTSMFTGLSPKSHGVNRNGQKLPENLRTLPEILRENGYATVGIVSSYILNRVTGFNRGFAYYYDGEKPTKAPNLLERAMRWLRRHQGDRFFLFLHFMDPHKSYKPPPKYRKWGGNRVARYDGEILFVDTILEELFAYLRETGTWDNTIIILTADHGESLGRDNYWDHMNSLYEEVIKVPLIIRLPGNPKTPPGRITYQTSMTDLTPTILNLLEIRDKTRMEGLDLFGGAVRNREYVFSQRRHIDGQDDPAVRDEKPRENFEYGDKYAVRTNDMKYLHLTRGEDELYDLKNDPGEKNNLLKTRTDMRKVADRYRKVLMDWLKDTPLKSKQNVQIDEDVKEKLKSLGYVN